MIYLENKSAITWDSRVVPFFLYLIVEHFKLSKLYLIDRHICKQLYAMAAKEIVVDPQKEAINLDRLMSSVITFKSTNDPFTDLIFSYAENSDFVNYSHFIQTFKRRAYIESKMSHIYWTFVDNTISNSLKNMKSKTATYSKRFESISNSLTNISCINNTSELLFHRYRKALEPHFFIHCILHDLVPLVNVRFAISQNKRPCSFGNNCRAGHVILWCRMTSSNGDSIVGYCMCNKHMKELQSREILSFS